MIVGYHVSFGAYGFWLPNDPRGSWSTFVGKWDIFRAAGKATKTTETRSVAHQPHDTSLRLTAKKVLDRPSVVFTYEQRNVIGQVFGNYFAKAGINVWACAVMPDHVHLVFATHRLKPEAIVNKLKGGATNGLVNAGIHPFQHLKPSDGPPPKCFAQGEWVIFLDVEDVAWHVEYVENNPIKAGLPRQQWEFARRPDIGMGYEGRRL
jgi:REP element-mobilizing transposase RayT